MDLQDLSPDFEHERSATVTDISGLSKAMNMNLNNLGDILYVMLNNQNSAFDLFTDFLNEHKIDYEYFSG